MSKFSQDVIDEVLREHRRTSNSSPFKVSTKVGIPAADVWAILQEHLTPEDAPTERYEGLGRPELIPYCVARRKADGVWDNNEPSIAKARYDYEQGTHEMATGRDGNWLLLYSIPRRKIEGGRLGYFSEACNG